MTKETTFKEFVEEKGLVFSQLRHGSEEYKALAKQFNDAKLEITQQEEEEKVNSGQNGL